MATDVTMEIHTDVPTDFMARFPRYEPVSKDHTQIITAKTCLRKYFYQIVLGRVPQEEAIYFAWGSAYHKFREVLEIAYGIGPERPNPFDSNKAVDAFTAATNAGMDYWHKRGSDQPVGSKFEWMTAARLLKSFMAAYDHWAREKQQGRIQVIATEQLFNVPVAWHCDGCYTRYKLSHHKCPHCGSSQRTTERTSGRADQIVRWNGTLWGRDFKTTSKEEKFFSRGLEPNDQFTRYTYAEGLLCGEPIQGQIVEALYNAKSTKNKKNGPDIYTLIASRTPTQIEQWRVEEVFWRGILDMARNEDMYPMQEVSCPFCPYHSVCTKPSEAGMMAQLESFYNVRPWDNSKIGIVE